MYPKSVPLFHSFLQDLCRFLCSLPSRRPVGSSPYPFSGDTLRSHPVLPGVRSILRIYNGSPTLLTPPLSIGPESHSTPDPPTLRPPPYRTFFRHVDLSFSLECPLKDVVNLTFCRGRIRKYLTAKGRLRHSRGRRKGTQFRKGT